MHELHAELEKVRDKLPWVQAEKKQKQMMVSSAIYSRRNFYSWNLSATPSAWCLLNSWNLSQAGKWFVCRGTAPSVPKFLRMQVKKRHFCAICV